MSSIRPASLEARRACCLQHRETSFLPSLRGLQCSSRHRAQPQQQQQHSHICRAGLGIGYLPESSAPEKELIIPKPVYGLFVREMAALGITPEAAVLEEEEAMESLRATACYGMDKVSENTRQVTRMGGGAGTGAAPGQAPPDLPSLLLDGRICFIGMALVPAVTELVISELLWLNYSAPDKPVYVYINSIGSQDPLGRPVGFETEAYAILDTLNYIRPEIHTLAVGNAFGNAAMILASGKKGQRFSLPNARITVTPPRMNRSFGNASNIMIKANELENNTATYVDFMSQFTGKDKEVVRKDIGRNRYFTPQQAIEYGVIDRIVQPSDAVAIEGKNYEAQLQASQAQQRGQRVPAGAGASAEGGY